jgi:hypothetical protein
MLRRTIRFGLLLLLAPAAAAVEPVPPGPADRLKVLLLDYNAPEEHDVVQSYLCVDPCTREGGCPDALVRDGADSWSDAFLVYRPRYMGRDARFVVDVYKQRGIDLLSISGHHASGFSGEYRRGLFETDKLRRHLDGSVGAAGFFTSPAMVMLHGCRTDVKSKFDGDPVEYLLHVIDETRVREDEFERLMAAVQQIGGVQQAYRDLFPNACLLGYRGTQTPGGRYEIYRQVDRFLRLLAQAARLLPAGEGGEVAPRISFTDSGSYAEAARRVDAECPGGWPCNLCRRDPDYYGPLADALERFLRRERVRIHELGRTRGAAEARQIESALESASFYSNTRWSCSSAEPGTAPVWPDPVDESPFGRLFLRLLWLDLLETLQPDQQRLLQRELVHRLGTITFREIDRIELRAWIKAPQHWQILQDFLQGPLLTMSSWRQRDFFAFLANVGCTRCLELAFADGVASILRENAASRFVPELGEGLYRRALADADPRVRAAAAERLGPELGHLLEAPAAALTPR